MLKKLCLAIGLVGLAAAGSTPAQAQGGVRVGTLNCSVASGWGFVFGSSKALRCTFAPSPGHAEFYAGTINKFGVDIGYTQGGVLVWAVFAPTANLSPGALNGNYVGATGSATVGVGAGANVLVGGSTSPPASDRSASAISRKPPAVVTEHDPAMEEGQRASAHKTDSDLCHRLAIFLAH
jgi:hypothetical protein